MNVRAELLAAKQRGLQIWRAKDREETKRKDENYQERFAKRSEEVLEFIKTRVMPEIEKAGVAAESGCQVPFQDDMDEELCTLICETLKKAQAYNSRRAYKDHSNLVAPNGAKEFLYVDTTFLN